MKVKSKGKAGSTANPTPEAPTTRTGDVQGNNNASVRGFVRARGRTLRLALG